MLNARRTRSPTNSAEPPRGPRLTTRSARSATEWIDAFPLTIQCAYEVYIGKTTRNVSTFLPANSPMPLYAS
jgi:hypothetical protein